MAKIAGAKIQDVRFPTSQDLAGSDATHPSPDYSAAYLQLDLNSGESGHALVFTGGRGNEIIVSAITSYVDLIKGIDADWLLSDMGRASSALVHDPQLRWLGPEKGVAQMAAGAVVNALWDIKAKRAELPLWELVAQMTPEEIVSVIDFTHIQNALTPDEALGLLVEGQFGKEDRIQQLKKSGFPAYTTSPGWLGYSDEKMLRLVKEAVDDGFPLIKLKVGGDISDDRRRLAAVRDSVGPDFPIAIDANQKWEVEEAIEWIRALSPFDPYWIEEPTSTDDVIGHSVIRQAVQPIRVATGEAVQSRIIVKQLLQADAIDILQIDATRVAGVSENLANLLLAKKFGVIVCPHAGGVGLCELVQHFSFIDYAIVGADQRGRFIEYVDNLHEHFVNPALVKNGRYEAPSIPGVGAEMFEDSRERWLFPNGPIWRELGRKSRR